MLNNRVILFWLSTSGRTVEVRTVEVRNEISYNIKQDNII